MWQRGSLSGHNDSKSWRIDSKSWCHERQVYFVLKREPSARTAPRTRAFINLRDDRHAWTDQNSFTGIDRQSVHLKCIKMYNNIAIINGNNNFAPSIFRSLCEFVGDCFGPRYFSEGAYTAVQNNHLRFHTMTSKKMVRSYYCLITIPSTDRHMSELWLFQIFLDCVGYHASILSFQTIVPMNNSFVL